MEHLKMHSPNMVDQNIEKLAELFPGCVTEAQGEDGKLRKAIDFDLLKQELSRNIVEGPQERYQLNWPGKREALLTANAPIAKTLRPCREESVDFDTTQNLFIEGDNLDALKLLQETYLNKVKLIYIDPPYNTGNDFIYADDFAEGVESYVKKSNQVDEQGNRLVVNTESNGRFHSDWLSMMYSRIKLSKDYLAEDGVLFISIDESEVANLTKLCIELFGENNLIATMIWEKGRKNDARFISVGHEYILVVAKNKHHLVESDIRWREPKPGAKEIHDEYLRLQKVWGNDYESIQEGIREFYASLPKAHPSKKHTRYNKVDKYGVWRDDNMSWPGSGGPRYDVIHPETGLPCAVPDGGWRYSSIEKMQQMIDAGKVVFREDHTQPPIRKTYLIEAAVSVTDEFNPDNDDEGEELPIQVAGSYFYRSGLQASNELLKHFPKKVFNNPKDHEVLVRLFDYVGLKSGDIVLDFFAGSGSTAHAVMELASKQSIRAKFILVQLQEEISGSDATSKNAVNFLSKLGAPSYITEISKERIRRAGTKIHEECEVNVGGLDVGFRVLKIDSSNMADVYYQPDAMTQADLFAQVDNVKEDRTEEDLLFQVMLDWGVDLTLPIRRETVDGKTVFFVADNALVACFDKESGINEAFVKELAKSEPLRLVFRDAGFASDSTKINVEQVLKQLSPNTDVKSI